MYDRPIFRPDPSLEEITPTHPSSSPPQIVSRAPVPRRGSGVGIAWFISIVAVTLIIAVFGYTTLVRPGASTNSTITPTPEITPIPPTQANTFVAGDIWKGTGHNNGGWTTEQVTLKVDTQNPDGSYTGTFEWNDQTMVSDTNYSINGKIVHDFSDSEWGIIQSYQGMDSKTPGVWSIFSVNNLENNGSYIFYIVARDNGKLDGYAIDESGNVSIEIHMDKTS